MRKTGKQDERSKEHFKVCVIRSEIEPTFLSSIPLTHFFKTNISYPSSMLSQQYVILKAKEKKKGKLKAESLFSLDHGFRDVFKECSIIASIEPTRATAIFLNKIRVP